ncbi:flagellar basal body L-ring protein FlgH [Polymorphobacter sp. PAMC 29334]|nr:flagellar basal body L-ring protein FlgH [Polymorphobacter sp. PAMC 29334]
MGSRLRGNDVAILALLALALTGCADTAFRTVAPIAPAYAAAPLPAPEASASLYRADRFIALASDNRARRVGDLLTIRLTERMTARKSATADSKRDGSAALTLPTAAPFSFIPKGLLSGGSTSTFKGSGTATQDNLLSGEISVTIARILPNGVYLVAGDKRVTLNRGEEQVQLTGMVRADDIGPDNAVASTRVADARIRYSGSGELADATRQGWLARFFAKVSPL